MVEVKTVRHFLADIIEGKDKKPTCTGFPIPGTHEPVEWTLDIGKHWYGFGCPICGFGQAGSLTKDESNWLLKLQRER